MMEKGNASMTGAIGKSDSVVDHDSDDPSDFSVNQRTPKRRKLDRNEGGDGINKSNQLEYNFPSNQLSEIPNKESDPQQNSNLNSTVNSTAQANNFFSFANVGIQGLTYQQLLLQMQNGQLFNIDGTQAALLNQMWGTSNLPSSSGVPNQLLLQHQQPAGGRPQKSDSTSSFSSIPQGSDNPASLSANQVAGIVSSQQSKASSGIANFSQGQIPTQSLASIFDPTATAMIARQMQLAAAAQQHSATTSAAASNTTDPKLTGRQPVVLYMTCDDDSLSEYQCLVRKQIELFEARREDVESNAQGRNRPIVMGQVGIRCRHCTMLPPKHRARGGVYYPAKLHGLYQAAQNMASSHLCEHCQHVPPPIRAELLKLRDRKSSAGGGKKYWADGVRVLGVFEDEDGLRFDKR